MKFDIIIPHFGTERTNPLALKCVQSIKRHSHDHRLIWVDNGGLPDPQLEQELTDTHIIKNPENMGFVRAVNQGLRVSDAPFVVLMNNDTEAVPSWLDDLCRPLISNIGASGPLTTAQGSWQGNWRRRGGITVLHPTAMLAFFCVMIRRDVIEKVGLLDESFGVGFGDDDDYCARMHAAGYRIAVVESIVIPHHHRATFRQIYTEAQIKKMQDEALDHFRRKKYA